MTIHFASILAPQGRIPLEKIVETALREGIKAQEEFVRENSAKVIQLAEKIASAFTRERKLMLCGNGGSAADAQHLAAEFVNRFLLERPPLPAVSLTTDTSVITSVANDYSFEEIFTKQIKAIGVEGDVLLAITTSGNSPNVLSALKTARKMGIYSALLTGGNGGKARDLADLCLSVKSGSTPRIQEVHIFSGHLICQLVDHLLFQRGIRANEPV
jgi:D-sedoheptulose 7-phosphate isomerase